MCRIHAGRGKIPHPRSGPPAIKKQQQPSNASVGMSCRYGKINRFCNFVKSVVVEWCNCLETCSDVACEYEAGLVNPVFWVFYMGPVLHVQLVCLQCIKL